MMLRVNVQRDNAEGPSTTARWGSIDPTTIAEIESLVGFLHEGDVVNITVEVLPNRPTHGARPPVSDEEPF